MSAATTGVPQAEALAHRAGGGVRPGEGDPDVRHLEEERHLRRRHVANDVDGRVLLRSSELARDVRVGRSRAVCDHELGIAVAVAKAAECGEHEGEAVERLRCPEAQDDGTAPKAQSRPGGGSFPGCGWAEGGEVHAQVDHVASLGREPAGEELAGEVCTGASTRSAPRSANSPRRRSSPADR